MSRRPKRTAAVHHDSKANCYQTQSTYYFMTFIEDENVWFFVISLELDGYANIKRTVFLFSLQARLWQCSTKVGSQRMMKFLKIIQPLFATQIYAWITYNQQIFTFQSSHMPINTLIWTNGKKNSEFNLRQKLCFSFCVCWECRQLGIHIRKSKIVVISSPPSLSSASSYKQVLSIHIFCTHRAVPLFYIPSFYLVIYTSDNHFISIKISSPTHSENDAAGTATAVIFYYSISNKMSPSIFRSIGIILQLKSDRKIKNEKKNGVKCYWQLAEAGNPLQIEAWKKTKTQIIGYKPHAAHRMSKGKIRMILRSHQLTAINNQKRTGKHLAKIPKCMLQFYVIFDIRSWVGDLAYTEREWERKTGAEKEIEMNYA